MNPCSIDVFQDFFTTLFQHLVSVKEKIKKIKGNILLLYTCFFIKSIDERLFNFAIPILFSEMYGQTLLPGALYALVTNLVVFAFGPNIGNLVDRFSRFNVVMISSVIQNICISITGVLCILLYKFPSTNPFLRWESAIFYILAILFGCVIQIASTISNISLKKDWAIILAKDKDSLTFVNASISRISLICEMIAPLLFSLVILISNVTQRNSKNSSILLGPL
jgi:solute carrier family 40 (iron-regulated transporter), member 1